MNLITFPSPLGIVLCFCNSPLGWRSVTLTHTYGGGYHRGIMPHPFNDNAITSMYVTCKWKVRLRRASFCPFVRYHCMIHCIHGKGNCPLVGSTLAQNAKGNKGTTFYKALFSCQPISLIKALLSGECRADCISEQNKDICVAMNKISYCLVKIYMSVAMNVAFKVLGSLTNTGLINV
jgi:hypothetical protein